MTPYLVFGLLTLMVWTITFKMCRETRQAQLFMSGLGLIGGPILDLLVYSNDFWKPSQPLIPFGSMLFGFGFIGAVTASTLSVPDGIWRPEDHKSVSRQYKLWTLGGMVISGWLAYMVGMNSVLATSFACWGGAGAILHSRPDLLSFIWRGAIGSFVTYGLLMLAFLVMLVVIGNDPVTLAKAYSPFYMGFGPIITGGLVLFWAAAVGALVGPLYPWGKNLRFAPT